MQLAANCEVSLTCAAYTFFSRSVFREFTDVNGARELKKHRGLGDDSWDYFLFVQTSPSGDCYFEVGWPYALGFLIRFPSLSVSG